jgi:hypothetical protein
VTDVGSPGEALKRLVEKKALRNPVGCGCGCPKRNPVSQADREDFRGFVRNASDRQLYGILEKEREGARRTRSRQAYVEITEAEIERRGLSRY